MQIETKLKELGLELPPPGKPVANYVLAVRSGNLIFLSGHGPISKDGSWITGKVGADLTLEEGYQAARQTALVLLTSLKEEIGVVYIYADIYRGFVSNNLPSFWSKKVSKAYG